MPDVSIRFTTDYYGLVNPAPVGFVYHFLDALVRVGLIYLLIVWLSLNVADSSMMLISVKSSLFSPKKY